MVDNYNEEENQKGQSAYRVKRSDVIGTPSISPDRDVKKVSVKVNRVDTDEDNPPLVRISDNKSIGIVFKHAYVTTMESIIVGENLKRNSLLIRNLSAETVWIGESGVLAGLDGNGWPLKTDEVINLDKSYGAIFGIAENNTAVLAVIEE